MSGKRATTRSGKEAWQSGRVPALHSLAYDAGQHSTDPILSRPESKPSLPPYYPSTTASNPEYFCGPRNPSLFLVQLQLQLLSSPPSSSHSLPTHPLLLSYLQLIIHQINILHQRHSLYRGLE